LGKAEKGGSRWEKRKTGKINVVPNYGGADTFYGPTGKTKRGK